MEKTGVRNNHSEILAWAPWSSSCEAAQVRQPRLLAYNEVLDSRSNLVCLTKFLAVQAEIDTPGVETARGSQQADTNHVERVGRAGRAAGAGWGTVQELRLRCSACQPRRMVCAEGSVKAKGD